MKDTSQHEDIYSMQLHDILRFPDFTVMRVAGGWIYRTWDYEKQNYSDGIYVPSNDEFMSQWN